MSPGRLDGRLGCRSLRDVRDGDFDANEALAYVAALDRDEITRRQTPRGQRLFDVVTDESAGRIGGAPRHHDWRVWRDQDPKRRDDGLSVPRAKLLDNDRVRLLVDGDDRSRMPADIFGHALPC